MPFVSSRQGGPEPYVMNANNTAQQRENNVVRTQRDPAAVSRLPDELERAAPGSENLRPHFVGCLEADVRLGEICGRLRSVWGEYSPSGS